MCFEVVGSYRELPLLELLNFSDTFPRDDLQGTWCFTLYWSQTSQSINLSFLKNSHLELTDSQLGLFLHFLGVEGKQLITVTISLQISSIGIIQIFFLSL